MAGFRDKLQRLIRPPGDEMEEYYEEEEDSGVFEESDEELPSVRKPLSFSSFSSRTENRSERSSSAPKKTQGSVRVYKPTSFSEDTRAIADDLIKRYTVVLILDRADKENSRRIVDFLSGVTYANQGTLKLVAANTVVITPYNVDLSVDDLMDDLDNGSVYF